MTKRDAAFFFTGFVLGITTTVVVLFWFPPHMFVFGVTNRAALVIFLSVLALIGVFVVSRLRKRSSN